MTQLLFNSHLRLDHTITLCGQCTAVHVRSNPLQAHIWAIRVSIWMWDTRPANHYFLKRFYLIISFRSRSQLKFSFVSIDVGISMTQFGTKEKNLCAAWNKRREFVLLSNGGYVDGEGNYMKIEISLIEITIHVHTHDHRNVDYVWPIPSVRSRLRQRDNLFQLQC